MATTRNILVVGATGQQGSAVVDALLKLPASVPPFHILAVTRNTESAKARALVEANPSSITLVKGDIKDPSTTFEAHPSNVSSVFIFTVIGNEDVAGKAWVDAALEHKVEQIVLSTVDRGGERSWDNPTNVPHFRQKHAVETHLRDRVEELSKTGQKVRWTILRPTAFLENMNPGTFCKVFTAMWSTLAADRSLQFISTRDLGSFAARAIADPATWDRKATSLAGADITYSQAQEIFKRVIGQDLPQTWAVLARGMFLLIPDVGRMFEFFEREGYGADIAALQQIEPSLQDFETWLKETSTWVKS
jgi:uncharacterized protein YbjT (DUF2867 family)